ncbi:MAG TPA: restriction endonuclease PLD domain-containing protein [Pyrinomonadaceae bacterium]|jgi:hypothetical protein
MLYKENLENIIFHRHEIFQCDEIIVLSGYVGPKPTERLQTLPFRATVVYGMYGAEGIKTFLHRSLTELQDSIQDLNIFYSSLPVHSKCYVWRYKGKIVHALVGSANFSRNGLTTPFREILAETTFDTFEPLNSYIQHVLNNSISCLEANVTERKKLERRAHPEEVCLMTLLDPSTNETPGISGLNWGQNPDNHTRPNDAYIPIRTAHIRNFPELFPPKQAYSTDPRGRPQRHNDAIEIIWDDGTNMEGLLEGSQPVDGEIYPKNLSSFPVKSELGEYLRYRIGVPSGQPVRRHHLERYGRTDVAVSIIGEGLYRCDFSV